MKITTMFWWVLKPLMLVFFLLGLNFYSSCWCLHVARDVVNSPEVFVNHTAISEFRILNRKSLFECPDPNPYLKIDFITSSKLSNKLSDEEYIKVRVSGVLFPSDSDWVAMISPAHSE